jgi:ubiquinone/menaquinone biosynthesis C-methylase UbiE
VLEKLRQAYLLLTGHRRNTVANNRRVWSQWDWSQCGEEWSNSDEWKASLVKEVLYRHIPRGGTILEIGPGGGRWTEYLLPISSHLILVDVTKECIDVCRDRFADIPQIEYHVNDGRDLGFVPTESVNAIWSWDVFVHVAAVEIERYVEQFQRILSPGGTAVIHHSRLGVSRTGWRSDMTSKKMNEFCSKFGLMLQEQFEEWDNGVHRIWPGLPLDKCPDTISVIRKP